MKHALVLGATGQDGSYLSELLLAQDYRVFGMIRRTSTPSTSRIAHLLDRIELVTGDVTDMASLQRVLQAVKPQEVYNLAAQSHVGESFGSPRATAEITGLGALNVFEAIRLYTASSEHVRIYQASSSEQFGQATETPQTEETPFAPVSPYSCAKTLAHHLAQTYRKSYGMFISCGIAYNHESERRGEQFVTRKITQTVAKIKAGQQSVLRLGNLTAQRDWSHAEDIVRGMWLTLGQSQPDDYILASGVAHSVQEFVDLAFLYAGLNPSDYLIQDHQLYRPTDIQRLVGNATKASIQLGWKPAISFPQLVYRMVSADLDAASTLHPDPVPEA